MKKKSGYKVELKDDYDYTEDRGNGEVVRGKLVFSSNNGQVLVESYDKPPLYYIPAEKARKQFVRGYAKKYQDCVDKKDASTNCEDIKKIVNRYDKDLKEVKEALHTAADKPLMPLSVGVGAGGPMVPLAIPADDHAEKDKSAHPVNDSTLFGAREKRFANAPPLAKGDIPKFASEFSGTGIGEGELKQEISCVAKNHLSSPTPDKTYNQIHGGSAILKTVTDANGKKKYLFYAGAKADRGKLGDGEGVELEFGRLNDPEKEGVGGFVRPLTPRSPHPCADPFYPDVHPRMYEIKKLVPERADEKPKYIMHYQSPGQFDVYCDLAASHQK